jgi:hypothetical protein
MGQTRCPISKLPTFSLENYIYFKINFKLIQLKRRRDTG